MDLFLGSFAERNLEKFGAEALAQYSEVLEISDPELYDWIMKRSEPPVNRVTPVLLQVLAHNFTEEK